MPDNIDFEYGSFNILTRIKPLWTKLNEHHYENSKNESERFKKFTFEHRMEIFRKKGTERDFLVIIAIDVRTGEDVGYCVSCVGGDEGEIESLFVLEEYRGKSIGDAFMEKSIEWLKKRGGVKISIKVAEGNENAFGFYEKYGFYLSSYNLRRR